MTSPIDRLLATLQPGDITHDLDHDTVYQLHMHGVEINDQGVVSIIDPCAYCDTTGMYRNRECPVCDGYGMTENFGKGLRPFKS